jgi:hypothetical protein
MASQEFIFAYDLVGKTSDKDLLEDLRSKDAVHVQKSVWYLKGSYSCSALRDHFKTLVGDDDRLLVVRIDDWATRKPIAPIPKS